MNKHLQLLCNLASKAERRVIGLMSGTSLDGLDVACCRISGSGPDTRVVLEQFRTVAYSEEQKVRIRAIFAKRQVDFEHVCLLNPYLGRLHGQLVRNCLQDWNIAPTEVDLVASHGQTVFHAPKTQHGKPEYPNATLQLGDGDHVAAETGVITLSDFRQKHTAHGGEGAPLAVYGDYFIFSERGQNRILLNMGGIANFTYLPADAKADAVFTTDTGPGNTLMDAYAQVFLNQPFDQDGQLAKTGKVVPALLEALKKNPFFSAPFPKTTGPEVFSRAYVEQAQQQSQTTGLAPADLMATLARFSAETIAEGIARVLTAGQPHTIYMSGGGAHNPLLTSHLRALLPSCTFDRTGSLGIAGDAKEAVLFAVLANEAVAGGNTYFGDRQGVPSVTMGKISFPG